MPPFQRTIEVPSYKPRVDQDMAGIFLPRKYPFHDSTGRILAQEATVDAFRVRISSFSSRIYGHPRPPARQAIFSEGTVPAPACFHPTPRQPQAIPSEKYFSAERLV